MSVDVRALGCGGFERQAEIDFPADGDAECSFWCECGGQLDVILRRT